MLSEPPPGSQICLRKATKTRPWSVGRHVPSTNSIRPSPSSAWMSASKVSTLRFPSSIACITAHSDAVSDRVLLAIVDWPHR
jgi:hypothetical protein